MNSEFSHNKIAFIGAGNMSRSIIGGLVNQGYVKENIIAANPSTGKLVQLGLDFGIDCHQNNLVAARDADVIVLSVKPQMLASVCQQLSVLGDELNNKLFISVAAGVTCERIQTMLEKQVPVIRCMPNTPALYGKGASGLYSHGANQAQQDFAEQMMRATGFVTWVEQESQIDAVTAVSGSGPAYFFLFMEAMVAKAQQLGFDEETAKQLVKQTAMGAATMAQQSDIDIAQLRQNVTSKGGTTAAALDIFNQNQLSDIVNKALQGAKDRAQELAKTL